MDYRCWNSLAVVTLQCLLPEGIQRSCNISRRTEYSCCSTTSSIALPRSKLKPEGLWLYLGGHFQAVGIGQGCLRISITSCFCSTSERTRRGGDSSGGSSSPVILHSHAGFEFWDLPAVRVSYQTHPHCCTSTAAPAWAASPHAQPGFTVSSTLLWSDRAAWLQVRFPAIENK